MCGGQEYEEKPQQSYANKQAVGNEGIQERGMLWKPNETVFQESSDRGFPGGAVVKNPPASAGDTGSSPGPGGSHMPAEQPSPCATTTEPAL